MGVLYRNVPACLSAHDISHMAKVLAYTGEWPHFAGSRPALFSISLANRHHTGNFGVDNSSCTQDPKQDDSATLSDTSRKKHSHCFVTHNLCSLFLSSAIRSKFTHVQKKLLLILRVP